MSWEAVLRTTFCLSISQLDMMLISSLSSADSMAAILLLVASISGWSTPVIRDGDPAMIGACLAQPDGTTLLSLPSGFSSAAKAANHTCLISELNLY